MNYITFKSREVKRSSLQSTRRKRA